MGGARRRPVALPDHGGVAQYRQHGALQLGIESQVAIEPATEVEGRRAQGLADVEDQRGRAVGVDDGVAEYQVDGARHAVDGHGQGRGADERLAIAELVAHHQLAFVEEILTEGEKVRDRQVQAVVQDVVWRQAGLADIGLHADRFEQGDGLGDKTDGLAGAGKVDGGIGCHHIAGVQGRPLASGGGRAHGDGDGIAADRVDDCQAVGVDFRHVERNLGSGGRAEVGIGYGKGADKQIVGSDRGGDGGGVGDDRAIVQGNRGQGAAGTGRDCGDLDVVGQGLGDDHVSEGLAQCGRNRQGQGPPEIGTGRGLALGRGQRLVEGQYRRVYGKADKPGLDQAGVGEGVVLRIVAELEAAIDGHDQVGRAVGKGGIGQVAQAGVDLHGNHRLVVRHAGEGQFQHHQLVAGPHAVGAGGNDQEITVGILGQGVGGIAGGIEHHHMGNQLLAQVGGGNEVDAIVAVFAGNGHEQVDKRRIAFIAGAVAEIHRKTE
ncbi:hypothetical protein D3C76_712010 [compost metagenome]